MSSREIKVISSIAFKSVYLEMLPLFEQSTGFLVNTLWLPTVEMTSRLKNGEAADLVIMSQGGIEDLIECQVLKPESKTNYLQSVIGVGVQRGALKPDLSSVENFKKSLLEAKSIAYSTGPSGVYLLDLFRKIGISEQIKDKIKIIQGEPVGEVVQRGEAEIGFQQVPEILDVPGIDYAGPLPPEIQKLTVFSFGIHVLTKNEDIVLQWIKFLKSPAGLSLAIKRGLEPVLIN
ncbi:MAG: substrate-binding domain-containing protein [Betaproteobacteria bacterium]|jgi:molybdate transport system substrate-binding protein